MNTKKKLFAAVLFFSLIIGGGQYLSAQVLPQDSLALVALYDSTDGANWTNNTNWLSGSVSTWYGITVIAERVTRIVLYNNNLSGTIPPALGNLDSLQYLYLGDNQLTGSIPTALGNLDSLQNLYLYGNQLSGSIPPELGNLSNLRELSLNNNQLSGAIPAALGNLSNLRSLRLYSNQLTDSIPSALGNLSNLRELCLNNNQLSGGIPSALGNLSNLSSLYLGDNQLNGAIPTALGNLSNLKSLHLSSNQLSGGIPSALGSLSNLQYLYLGDNQLSGAIPTALGNLSNLQKVQLQNNQLIDMPDFSGSAMSDTIQYLYVQENQLTFEDIEPNVGISPTFNYSQQDNVGTEKDTTVDAGSSFTFMVLVGGTANQYQWMKDGVDIAGADSSSYIISPVDSLDSGSYICKITNTIAAELTLYSRPVNLTVPGSVGIAGDEYKLLQAFALHQNYPNPFNPVTHIKFALPTATQVRIDLFNVLGKRVHTLLDSKKPAGYHTITFDAKHLASGIYFYTIKTKNFYQSKRMLLIK